MYEVITSNKKSRLKACVGELGSQASKSVEVTKQRSSKHERCFLRADLQLYLQEKNLVLYDKIEPVSIYNIQVNI